MSVIVSVLTVSVRLSGSYALSLSCRHHPSPHETLFIPHSWCSAPLNQQLPTSLRPSPPHPALAALLCPLFRSHSFSYNTLLSLDPRTGPSWVYRTAPPLPSCQIHCISSVLWLAECQRVCLKVVHFPWYEVLSSPIPSFGQAESVKIFKSYLLFYPWL